MDADFVSLLKATVAVQSSRISWVTVHTPCCPYPHYRHMTCHIAIQLSLPTKNLTSASFDANILRPIGLEMDLMMSRKNAKGLKTKTKILETAASIFNQRGYNGVAISDIMEATDLQKGGIYRHFDNKDDLALQVFDYTFNRVSTLMNERIAEQHRTIDKLIAIIDTFQELIRPDAPIKGGCVVMNTAIEHDDGIPALRQRAQQAMNQWRQQITTILDDGITSNELSDAIDVDEVATVLISTLEGGVTLSRLFDNPTYAQQTRRFLVDYLINNLKS